MIWQLWLAVGLSWAPLLLQVVCFQFVIKPYDKKYFEDLNAFNKTAEERAIWIQKNNAKTIAKLERLAKKSG